MSKHWAFFEKIEVPDYTHPERNFMTRLRIVQTPWFGLYLHKFEGPDPRPTLHDHPWDFVSIILRGGYTERRSYGPFNFHIESIPLHGAKGRVRLRTWLRARINVKRAADVHYIEKLSRLPTWTLMLVGRKRHEWGYLDRDGTRTRWDLHPHNAEFEAALAARRAMK